MSSSDGREDNGSTGSLDGSLLQEREEFNVQEHQDADFLYAEEVKMQRHSMVKWSLRIAGFAAMAWASHSSELRGDFIWYQTTIVIAFGGALVLVSVFMELADHLFNKINSRGRTDGDFTDPNMHIERFDFTPTRLSARHAIMRFQVDVNYFVKFLKGVFLYCPSLWIFCEETTTRDVVRFLLNTSISMYLKVVETTPDRTVFVLELNGHMATFFPTKRYSDLRVKFSVPSIKNYERINLDPKSLHGAALHEFFYNDQSITRPSEQLLALSTICAFVVHPIVHSFSNGMYRRYMELDEDTRAKYDCVFRHSQYLNEIAAYGPSVTLGVNLKELQELISHNIQRPIPHHGELMARLAPYSAFVQYLFRARLVVQRLIRKHEVPLDPEHFFQVSIMHSADHIWTGQGLLYKDLSSKDLPAQRWPHLENYLWYMPSDGLFPGCSNLLKDHQNDNPFYSALYHELCNIDKTQADTVSLSVAF